MALDSTFLGEVLAVVVVVVVLAVVVQEDKD